MEKQITINTQPVTSWISRNWFSIIIVILLGIIVYFYLNRTDGLEKNIIKNDIESQMLKKKSDSTLLVIQKLEAERIQSRKSFILDSLKLAQLEKNFNQLKKKYDEKINAVDSYTDDELQKFFTDRYPE